MARTSTATATSRSSSPLWRRPRTRFHPHRRTRASSTIAAFRHPARWWIALPSSLRPAEEKDESADGGGSGSGMADIDAKLVRAFDRMIRSEGLTSKPPKASQFRNTPPFANVLKWIAAEECHAILTDSSTSAPPTMASASPGWADQQWFCHLQGLGSRPCSTIAIARQRRLGAMPWPSRGAGSRGDA